MDAKASASSFSQTLRKIGYVNRRGVCPSSEELEWLFGQSTEIDEILGSIMLVAESNFISQEERAQFDEMKESGTLIENFEEIDELYERNSMYGRLESDTLTESQQLSEKIDNLTKEVESLTAEKEIFVDLARSQEDKISLLLSAENAVKDEFEVARKRYSEVWHKLASELEKYKGLLGDVKSSLQEEARTSEGRMKKFLANNLGEESPEMAFSGVTSGIVEDLWSCWDDITQTLSRFENIGLGTDESSKIGRNMSFEINRMRSSMADLLYKYHVSEGRKVEAEEVRRLSQRDDYSTHASNPGESSDESLRIEIANADREIAASERAIRGQIQKAVDNEMYEMMEKYALITEKMQDVTKSLILDFVEILSELASSGEHVFAKLLEELKVHKELISSIKDVKEDVNGVQDISKGIEMISSGSAGDISSVEAIESPSIKAADEGCESRDQVSRREDIEKLKDITKQNQARVAELESMCYSVSHMFDFTERGTLPTLMIPELSNAIQKCKDESDKLVQSLEGLLARYNEFESSHSFKMRKELLNRLFIQFHTNPAGFRLEFDDAKRRIHMNE